MEKKYKIGDRVKHHLFGEGTIAFIFETGKKLPYTVQFDKEHHLLHDGATSISPKLKDNTCYFIEEEDVDLIQATSQP